MGAAYDEERKFEVYEGKKHFAEIRGFFGERCCYCGDDLVAGRTAQDHLTPMNKTSLGLYAWGNIVPACHDCNARKQGREWHAYLVQRAGVDTSGALSANHGFRRSLQICARAGRSA
jgi:5-methylcytosine-specific restriction endonuclease McrA